MNWFNYYGLIFVALIMIPNIIYAVKSKNSIANNYKNKLVEMLEQIGRYGCIVLMIFNIPYTWFGFYFTFAEIVYVVINAVLVIAYCVIWAILRNKNGITKSLLLSIIPSFVFLFSGVMIVSIPLIVFAVIFAVSHILISFKNTPKPHNTESQTAE